MNFITVNWLKISDPRINGSGGHFYIIRAVPYRDLLVKSKVAIHKLVEILKMKQ